MWCQKLSAVYLPIGHFRDKIVYKINVYWYNQWIFLFSSSTMYLSGTFNSRNYLIFYCLIRSNKAFWPWKVSCSCWFSMSRIFLPSSLVSCFSTICFFSSTACFLSSYFLSFSSRSSNSRTSFCFLMTASNSAFSALACSSSMRSFSFCCSLLAYCSYWLLLALISASTFSFSLAALSLASAALLALSASSSACLSEAFSCNYLSLWISFSFSSLILFCSAASSASLSAFSLM